LTTLPEQIVWSSSGWIVGLAPGFAGDRRRQAGEREQVRMLVDVELRRP
jgi:hypothetical protein